MEKTVSEAQDYNKELLGIAEGIRRYISYGGGSDGVKVIMTKSIAEALADFIEKRCHDD